MTVIVVSGKPGSGSTTISKKLAKKLNLDFFSSGLWFKQQFNNSLETKNETSSSLKGWHSEKGKSKDLHNKLDRLQRTIASKGDIVIDSKLGIHMLGDVADIKIWLEAPLSVRAARYSKRSENDIDTSIRELEEKEIAERTNWKNIYGFDYFSQRDKADLIIDTTDKSVDDIVDHIIRTGKSLGKI